MDGEELKKMEDEKSPFRKTTQRAMTGAVVGPIVGMVYPSWHGVCGVDLRDAPPVSIQRLKKMACSHGGSGTALFAIAVGVEQIMQKQRIKRDIVNGLVGGFVAGFSVFSYNARNISKALIFGAAGSVAYACTYSIHDPGRYEDLTKS